MLICPQYVTLINICTFVSGVVVSWLVALSSMVGHVSRMVCHSRSSFSCYLKTGITFVRFDVASDYIIMIILVLSISTPIFSAEPLTEGILHRIPAMEKAEIRQMINGPESFTPDMHTVLGEAPEVSTLINSESIFML